MLNENTPTAIPADLQACLDAQRAAYFAAPVPSLAQRRADLQALATMLKNHRAELVAAINADYGGRAEFETLFAEFFVVLQTINDNLKHVRQWMKPQRRHIDFMMYPLASNRVIPQPLGVVGVIVPWNFPLNLTFCPLAAIFAAGNRAMVKMSENSRHLAKLLTEISPKYFSEDKLKFFEDSSTDKGVDTASNNAPRGAAFSSMKFDHLLFTGSGATGRLVMANAAKNLTPVTLELGGKAPAIVAPDFDLKTAADRIMWVKLFNAGQICTNIDYVFVPEGSAQAFATLCQEAFNTRYPDLNNGDYTAIIDDKSYARLSATVDDAAAKGATLVNLAAGQNLSIAGQGSVRKFPPHLLLNPTEDMIAAQREIFGPILPIRTYKTRKEVAAYINGHDRPLAIYPFTYDKALQNYYIDHVMSGGVGVNEALLHVAQHDLPFGGVGPSGMGHYHSQEGFNTFSKLRPVFYQGPWSAIQMLFQAPYAGRPMQIINLLMKFRA